MISSIMSIFLELTVLNTELKKYGICVCSDYNHITSKCDYGKGVGAYTSNISPLCCLNNCPKLKRYE